MHKSSLAVLALLGCTVSSFAWAAEGDAAHNAALFKTQCSSCHKVDHNLVGPELGGVFGRKAGAIANFSYSTPLKASGLTWDAATLDKWLTGPAVLVPGTHMTLKVENPQDRADIIAYLKTLPPAE